ncbi:hypothetical protein FLJC2902T_26360 [Flavobacterium limnosediminis JC2902]|uniref:Uncharacterized protein n=1 Tax=Flavobacterium limnosediminis JC2902 TaxID=1341181 RepID=V6SJD3_9FLAO|nr:hypothetical protein FLJC2902T_26360 [Flavobacterium limnosediminis JC2902]
MVSPLALMEAASFIPDRFPGWYKNTADSRNYHYRHKTTIRSKKINQTI